MNNKALRSKIKSESIDDVAEAIETIQTRFKKYSNKNIERLFYIGMQKKPKSKTPQYSFSIYDNEASEDVYHILRDNFSEIFEEQVN